MAAMAGGKQKLTARAAAATKPGRRCDGAELYLDVAPSVARKWVYRFSFAGKVTEAGRGFECGSAGAEKTMSGTRASATQAEEGR
jgi:hypothetical protein